jgi:hypothetical protein
MERVEVIGMVKRVERREESTVDRRDKPKIISKA